MKNRLTRVIIALLLVATMMLSSSCTLLEKYGIELPFLTTAEEGTSDGSDLGDVGDDGDAGESGSTSVDISNIPAYTGNPYVAINGNKPNFTDSEITTKAFESYGELDALGRCTVAFACCGKETMPAEGEERGNISSVKPSGWVQAQYDCVSGKSLYNRCHMIGWQITAENANAKNLITGTNYLNIQGMLPFENMVADYIKETGNHVMYRVTPIYDGNNLVASGVQLEAYSVEDGGEGISFNVYCYNVQPGVIINYADGTSRLDAENQPDTNEIKNQVAQYVLNEGRKKIHKPECASVEQMAEHNRKPYEGTIADLMKEGYEPCGSCLAGIN